MMEIIDQLYQQYQQSHRVTTDSRQITSGCIFFALKGETFDGNAFARQALEQGAALCVISNPEYKVDDRCLVVEDVLAVLQQLAKHHREQLHIPFVGITGTNGKTTTKELVNAVLSKKYRTYATQGNFNNHLGVPLTLLAIPADAEIAIVEMGANHPGEIDFLCNIAQPTCGLITNVGKAHLEGFGSFEGVVRTKTELYRHLAGKKDSALFVNAGSEVLMQEARRSGVAAISYGSTEAMVKGSCVGCNPYMKFYFEDGDNVYTVQSQLCGSYNFHNAMAAVAVGKYFGVELFDIKEAIEEYCPQNNRSQMKRTERNQLLLDCYNANPSSMAAALDNFDLLQAEHKMVCLGGMKELGADSEQEHRTIAERLAKSPYERKVLVGEEFRPFCTEASGLEWFESSARAKEHFDQHPVQGFTVLIKGSNSNRMWELVDKF